jgi:DNA-binding MarR family transcriptional regulator
MHDAKRIPYSVAQEIRDGCLCFAAQKAARLLARRFDRVFAPLAITNGQFSMMVALGGMGNPRLGGLADFLAMDQTTLTAAVKALEARGLVVRKPDPEDQRARRVELTPAGTEVIARAVPIWRDEISAIRRDMGPERAGELLSLLRLPGVKPETGPPVQDAVR